ncbi:MAG: hypothetical protein ACJ0QH_03515 [Flavobacteriales bacterium]|jgi:cobalamin synthase
MGFRHLKQAKLTKKHMIWICILYLVYSIFGIWTMSSEITFDFQEFLNWELLGIAFIVFWIFLRFLNRLIYGEDGDTDADW